ncbi:unnamed protein product [Protopolystoma xenopodis]|uniref:Secreted protein n=1 Tax=Protopolystoma xenopodis TaxID=117903 RepID=A0A3S5AJ30_9PLAT|nr:unnamed protein product [Protopolystoma xenopodis]
MLPAFFTLLCQAALPANRPSWPPASATGRRTWTFGPEACRLSLDDADMRLLRVRVVSTDDLKSPPDWHTCTLSVRRSLHSGQRGRRRYLANVYA